MESGEKEHELISKIVGRPRKAAAADLRHISGG